MNKSIIDGTQARSSTRWTTLSFVATLLALGAFGIHQALGQNDRIAQATAGILLVFAAAGSIVNFLRRKNEANQIAAKNLAIQFNEKALDAHTIVNIAGPDGKIIAINHNFTTTFGYTEEEVIGRRADILYCDDATTQSYQEILTSVSQGQSWSGFQCLTAKCGKRVTVQSSIFPKFDAEGNVIEFVSIRTDMSGALAERVEMGRNAVVEALPDGVFIYDPDTFEIRYANKAFRTRIGWTDDASQAKSVTSLFNEDELKLFRNYIDPLITGETPQVVFDFEHQSGHVEVLTHMVKDIDGKRILVSVVRDISERKQAESLKLSSVSTVSHELRTPLTSIKGALRLLECGVMGDLNPDMAKLVGLAHRNSERLLAIVNDILTLEKLHSGDMAISMVDFDLRDLVNEAAEANAPFATECGVYFVVDPMPEPAYVRADPDRLMQVMSNLMSNAAKLSPVGTGVTLRLSDRGNVWRVCVEDKGPGIPEHARATLFDSFIQVEHEHDKGLPSTGLGLTIVREIMQRHGGRIAFDTKVGEGTTFYFELEKCAESSQSSGLSAVA